MFQTIKLFFFVLFKLKINNRPCFVEKKIIQMNQQNDSQKISFIGFENYQPHESNKKQNTKIKYNISNNHINRFFRVDDTFMEYPQTKKSTIIVTEQISKLQSVHDEYMDTLKQNIQNIQDESIREKYYSEIPQSNVSYNDETTLKTERRLIQKVFELKLYNHLILLKSCSFKKTLKEEIEHINVLFIEDMKNSQFSHSKNDCCMSLPLLVSSGNIVDVSDLYSTDNSGTKKWIDTKNTPINTNFIITSYINRLLSTLANMGMNRVNMVGYIERPNNKPYVEAEFLIVETDSQTPVESLYKNFHVRIQPKHFREIVIPFMKQNNMWDSVQRVFCQNRALKKKNFSILNYKQFKMLFQTASSYDNVCPSAIMIDPVTNVKNSFTIDLADFNGAYEKYPISNDENKTAGFAYCINHRLYIPNHSIKEIKEKVMGRETFE